MNKGKADVSDMSLLSLSLLLILFSDNYVNVTNALSLLYAGR